MNLRKFADLCKSNNSGLIVKDYGAYDGKADGSDLVETKLRVYVLPEDMVWPMFLVSSQRMVRCSNIYFCRMTPADIKRRDLTLQLLREGHMSPVWLGAEGIGKSADMNYILMELLTHIGEAGWPAIVAFRFNRIIAEFRYDSSSSFITISWHQGHVDNLLTYTEQLKDSGKSSALVLELGGQEKDPKSWVPMNVAVTFGDTKKLLKTSEKTGSLVTLLIPPPTLEELKLMARAELEFNPYSSTFKGSTMDQAMEVVTRRAEILGSNTRTVFTTESAFQDRQQLIDIDYISNDFFHYLNLFYNDNFPGFLRQFVAPYLKAGVEIPCLPFYLEQAVAIQNKALSSPEELRGPIFELRFLSDYISLNIAKTVKDVKEITILKSYNLDSKLAGSVIKYGILGDNMVADSPSPHWKKSQWEWHRDPGHLAELSPNTLLPTPSVPSVPSCTREITFTGHFLNLPAVELETGVLYRGVSNMAVGELLTVDHATRTVFVFRTTLGDVEDHPLKAKTIHKLMKWLSIVDSGTSVSSQYTVHVICFSDWSEQIRRGVKIVYDEALTVDSTTATVIGRKLTFSFIRACLYPFSKRHILLQSTQEVRTLKLKRKVSKAAQKLPQKDVKAAEKRNSLVHSNLLE